MKEITVQQLHDETERWVREAADNGGILVADHGRPVIRLERAAAARAGKPLPDREERIRQQPFHPIDSTQAISEDRDRL